MSVPYRVDDGNFSVPIFVGPPEINLPFADEGDMTSRIIRQKLRQDARNYKGAPAMSIYNSSATSGQSTSGISLPSSSDGFTIAPVTNWNQLLISRGVDPKDIPGKIIGINSGVGVGGSAYLVDEGPTRDIGNGIVEWWRTYATVPITRETGSTIGYSEQVAISAGEIIEYSTTKAARIVWEYFANNRPEAFLAPRIVSIGGAIYYVGGIAAWRTRLSGGATLACDQEVGIYLGKIYYRKSIYINPALSFITA